MTKQQMRRATEQRLEGQVAIVTGATAGIGPPTCRALAREGAHVVVAGRSEGRVAATVSSVRSQASGSEVLGLVCDVRREADMERMAARTLDRFGSIDVLIASAGILRARGVQTLRMLSRMSADEWDDVLDTNLKGVFLSNRAVLPAMIRQRSGHIINLSSTSGRKAYAFDTAYCASKFGVIGLSEALAEEVRAHGVRVDALLPGAVDTPMWDQNGPFRRPAGALPPERVAAWIVSMLALPDDAVLLGAVIEPFAIPPRGGWTTASES